MWYLEYLPGVDVVSGIFPCGGCGILNIYLEWMWYLEYLPGVDVVYGISNSAVCGIWNIYLG